MNFEKNWSILFEDMNIPEVFITEYMAAADGNFVKIYLYCLFLSKHGGEITPLDLSKKLSMPISVVEQGLKYLEENKLMTKKQKDYIINDIKQQEVSKLYTPKLTSSPEDAIKNTANNIKRTQAISAINGMYFQGVMSPTWYTDIDTLFSKYKFEEDTVIALFQYCFDRQALHRKYLFTVADAWAKNGIITMDDVDNYYAKFEKLNKIKRSIVKKLGFTRNLSEYEEAYVDKWVSDYKYPLEIIEIALKKTTSKTNPNFNYIDSILTNWHEHNLNTPAEINSFMKSQKSKSKVVTAQDNLSSLTKNKVMQKYTNTESSDFHDLSKFYAN